MVYLYHVSYLASDSHKRVREQNIYVQADSDMEAREVFREAMPHGQITAVHMAGDWGLEAMQ